MDYKIETKPIKFYQLKEILEKFEIDHFLEHVGCSEEAGYFIKPSADEILKHPSFSYQLAIIMAALDNHEEAKRICPEPWHFFTAGGDTCGNYLIKEILNIKNP